MSAVDWHPVNDFLFSLQVARDWQFFDALRWMTPGSMRNDKRLHYTRALSNFPSGLPGIPIRQTTVTKCPWVGTEYTTRQLWPHDTLIMYTLLLFFLLKIYFTNTVVCFQRVSILLKLGSKLIEFISNNIPKVHRLFATLSLLFAAEWTHLSVIIDVF